MPLEESLTLLSEQMRSADPTPETMKLLNAVWPALSPDSRIELMSRLGEPPSREEVGRWRANKALHRRLLRQWRWLTGVSENLPEPWRAAYAELMSEFGAGDPEARRNRVGYRVGSTSPISAQEISELGPDRFADWVATWEPPPSGWEVPTPAGLAQELSRAAQSSPEVWIGALPSVMARLRHPAYIRSVLDGVRETLVGESALPAWDRLVPVMELIVSEPWPVARLTEDDFDADSDWRECKRIITRLIHEAADKETPFGDATVERLWSVLLAVMRNRESASGVSGPDLLTAAINKLSTTALQGMFSLALSVSRRGGDFTQRGKQLADAVAEELASGDSEVLLAGAIVASLYPQFIHICGEAANGFIPQLFGSPDAAGLKSSVLETLLHYARPITNDMLRRFRPHLLSYLNLESHAEEDEESREAVRWLMIGYMRGLPDQDDPGVLVHVLSKPSRISEAAEFFGRVLRDTPEPEPQLIRTALSFWDEVLSTEGLDADAFQGFGWWAEGIAIEDDAWLNRLHTTLELTKGRIDWEDEVVKRLIRLSGHPKAWKSLSLLVTGASDRWEVSYWARNLHDLFKETQDSTGELRALREELGERLLERELLDFRQYLH